jgi:hypothetical protein
MKKISVIILGLMMLASSAAFAHSGGTDSNGCHHDHKSGGYHCH